MLISICNTYAQLNIADDTIKQQLEEKNNLQILGRNDIIVNNFIPLDSLVFKEPNRGFGFHDNVVGLKTYIYDCVYDNTFDYPDLQLCINKVDSTVTFKPMELKCYYDIIGIIRFDKQAKYHQQEIELLKLVPNETLQGHDKEKLSEIFRQWNKYFISTDEYIKRYIVSRYQSRQDDAIIYLLKNENNDIYYIKAYKFGDFNHVEHTKTNTTGCVHIIKSMYIGGRSIGGYKRIDIPYYEQFLKLKDKDVAIYSGNDEYIEDYVTKQPLVNKLNKQYIDNSSPFSSSYFTNPIYAKCSDIFISKDWKVCGLFEQEGAKFSLCLDYEEQCRNNAIRDINKLELTFFRFYGGVIYVKDVIETYKAYQTKTQQARAAAERELLRKQSAEKAQRESDIIAKYGNIFGRAIIKGNVMLGMTQEMCQDSWGFPSDQFNTITSLGTTSTWMYNYKTYLYFQNGKLIKIEN